MTMNVPNSRCALGSFWRDGHDHECPKFKEKKTGTSPKTERKSRENKKRQENGKCEARSSMSASGEQKYSHATTTPSVVSTMTTVTTTSPIGAVTTTNTTGVYHPSPSSRNGIEQFPRALPLFFPSPMFMTPFGRHPIFYQHSPLLAPSLIGLVFHPTPPRPLPYYTPLIVRPPVGIARKRRKPQVEYRRCCEKYCKYHVVDKPAGKTGAPPHCLDCPVRKQFRRPNN